MIVEEEVFISEVEKSYLLLSTSECSPLFIGCRDECLQEVVRYVRNVELVLT